MSLVVRGVLTKPCDFGKNSESLDVKDWVDRDLLVKRLKRINSVVDSDAIMILIRELERGRHFNIILDNDEGRGV